MQKFMSALPDVLIVAGVSAISYGAWLVHPAAGFIIGGMLASGLGVLASQRAQ
jgi:hypothetical protein